MYEKLVTSNGTTKTTRMLQIGTTMAESTSLVGKTVAGFDSNGDERILRQ